MATAVDKTAQLTSSKIRRILQLKKDLEPGVMQTLGKFNKRRELFDLMFAMPYLKISILEKKEIAHRETASLYLKKLEKANFLEPKKIGRDTYYINYKLMNILIQANA